MTGRFFSSPFRRCPKTGKIVGFNTERKWTTILFSIWGVAAILWFLIRVIPKPSRITYPCQQLAAGLGGGFLASLAGLGASFTIFQKMHIMRRLQTRGKAWTAAWMFGFCLAVGLFVFVMSTMYSETSLFAWTPTEPPNQPIGVARGIHPGRVAWAYDRNAVTWDGTTGEWWSDTNVNQKTVQTMLRSALRTLTGASEETAAWQSLFTHFNVRHGKGSVGYQAGEKIAIKINLNNTSSHAANNSNINASPQIIFAVLKSLIEKAQVPQASITVFDSSRYITPNIFDKCHAAYPDVVFVDHFGGDGRVEAAYVANAIPFSVDLGAQATGLAACAVEASYLIDMAILKGHGATVTLSAKNFFGATSIGTIPKLNSHNHFRPDAAGTPQHLTFTDFLGHKDLGEKTMLFLIEALYATEDVSGTPNHKWRMAPFNNNWPCSLFLSQDGVAIDSVALDFLKGEFPLTGAIHPDMYMHEAALADNPPSGTFYDPERDGIRCKSLGTHEHWNNATGKKYSRNLRTGNGIELVEALAAPSALRATPASPKRVNLSWSDRSSDESGFRIERKTGAGAFERIATVAADVTSYSDTGREPNTQYYYRVRAYNSLGRSLYSNQAGAKTLP